MKIIDGKILAEKIKDKIVKEILELKGVRPNLAIILVGDKEDSKIYVKLKEEEAKKVGIDTHLYKFPDNITDRELLDVINFLNEDKMIDAILVQLPLPEQLDTDGIILAIDPKKDVDSFHPDNLEKIYSSKEKDIIIPPVFAVVLEALSSIGLKLSDKKICVIANSDIFGRSLTKLLKLNKANAEAVKPDDKALSDKTAEADVLISAVGRPRFIKKDMIKDQAILIDVGINKVKGKICGDVDFNDVDDKAGFITPVPGGVGPMTIAMALKNTLELYKKRHNIS
jgi:methylenetetrahydrofolate dehydrogenase (NADP+)/methenyltetrahydrofolate cyclohydrolase